MIRLFKVSIPSNIIALLFSEAVLILSCYTLAAYLFLDSVAMEKFPLEDGAIWRIGAITTVLLLGIYLNDLYDSFRIRSHIVLIQQFCMVLGGAFLLQALANYGRWNILLIPKWVMLSGSLFVLLVLPLWRTLFVSLTKAIGVQRILFIGSSAAVRETIALISERSELGLAAVGYLEETDLPANLDMPAVTGAPRLGKIDDLDEVFTKQAPDRIVIGMNERRQGLPVARLLDLRYSGIKIEDVASIHEALFGRVSTRNLRPSQLIFSAELGPSRRNMTLQNIYSMILTIIGVVILLPVMLAVALVVKLTSPGPVLYRQKRVGLNGKVFTLFKFRSMRADCEKTTGAVWAKKDDPRITPVGKWLRKLRLDELPQLFNVLRGEMLLVGPRPERPEFVDSLQEKIPYYRQRHCVKPGISGWAQINYKYGDTIEDTITKLEYDLYYIKNLAPSLDAYIMFHTVKTMLLARGAQ